MTDCGLSAKSQSMWFDFRYFNMHGEIKVKWINF